ncbi:LysE family translocator [Peribacillus muralis]|uniref:LysE family translocator n=1 Tax=Peribacillus muralis TaxID=264697 RepID=UPI0031F3DC57
MRSGYRAILVLWLIIPGPAVIYIMAKSVDQGKKAGIVSVFGVSLGGSDHVLAGAIGVSAILMTSASVFNIAIYLGYRTLFSTSDRTTSEIPKSIQFLLLGIIFIILAFISDGLYAVLAASITKRILDSEVNTRLQNRITGYLYIVLEVFSAFASPSKT